MKNLNSAISIEQAYAETRSHVDQVGQGLCFHLRHARDSSRPRSIELHRRPNTFARTSSRSNFPLAAKRRTIHIRQLAEMTWTGSMNALPCVTISRIASENSIS